MRSYKVLTLTDHTDHSGENSVYAILRAMVRHDRCARVDIASRGNVANDPFFKAHRFEVVQAIAATENFDFQESGRQFFENTRAVDPRDYDLIFLRLPRPLSDAFLEGINGFLKNVAIINNPLGITTCGSKTFLLNFPEFCPPMALCKRVEEVLAFAEKQDMVLKPLRGYGGEGIVKISGSLLNDGHRDWDTSSYLKQIEKGLTEEGYLAMKFLKNVDQGDKRLLVVDGEILAAALRLPAANSWLCNVARGGTSVSSEPTKREREMVHAINPLLQHHGILIYGVDTLVDDDGERVLSEVNVMSIGGFPQAEAQTGKPILKMTIDKIFEYADAHYGY